MKKRKIRINNIELRESDFNNRFEILKITDNPLYKRQTDFEKEDDNYVQYVDGIHVRYSESCFENPESSYVIAWFEENESGSAPDLTWCMDRPLDLTPEEFCDFIDVIKFGYQEFRRVFEFKRETGN